MKTPTKSIGSRAGHIPQISVLSMATLFALTALSTKAADISWQGGTADYNTPANWVGGAVPGGSDNAINDNGTNNVVQIKVGDPDWTLNQIKAGNGLGNGAFVQNGQTVNLTGTNWNGSVVSVYNTPFRLGVVAGDTGVYTLNGGSINYNNGEFHVGELGTGILNINGGTIAGSGNFADNIGVLATPNAVTATVGNGLTDGEFTWFVQGVYTADSTQGLPVPGTTITSMSQADHSYIMPPSYTANDAVLISTNVANATITLTPAATYSGLSFLCTAGNGPVGVNYTVHHQSGTAETGSLSIPDWFGPGSAQEVLAVGSRVDALGVNFQLPGSANGFTGNAPYLWSLDITLANTTSPVTSIDLAYTSGGVATVLGVSGQTTSGGAFTPAIMTGYNEDVIVEAGAQSYVSGTVTDIVNQTAGSVLVTNGGQFFVGNFGTAVYNMSGGTFDVYNYIAFGRSGGNGTFNMSGGVLTQDGGGNLLIGTGYNAPSGTTCVGVLNQGGGTINCTGALLCPENSPSTGTYNMSNNAVLNVHDWIAIGRGGAVGIWNISGNAVVTRDNNNDGGANFDVGAGGPGTVNQNGGAVTNLGGQTWIGESSKATWNLNSGIASLGTVHISQTGDGSGTLNVNGGSLIANEITTGSTVAGSAMYLNGGTIVAAADSENFLHDLTVVGIDAGGAIFDSQGFDITISQELDDNGGGGLTKNGTATLSLTGPNTYVGATVVNAGTLIVGTSGSGAGDYTVADNAGFGVIEQSANSQLNVASLSMSGSTSAALDFDLAGFGNPTLAPLNVAGIWNVSGNIVINIADGAAQLGQFPLVKYGTLSGSPSFVLGTLPVGVSATLVNDVANNSIDLDITGANEPRWEGLAGGNWDIGVTTNWVNLGTGLPSFYTDGSPVIFNDSALGTTTVNLTTAVNPASITMTNSSLNYTFVGTGSIGGSIGLKKQGSGTLSLLNTGGNSYTGPTVVANGGTLIVTNLANGGLPSAIGASTASPANLVLNNGTFSYGGAPVTVNRGFTIDTTNCVIDSEGDFAFSGPIVLATNLSTGNEFIKAGPAQFAIKAAGNLEYAYNRDPGISVRYGTLLLDGSAGNQTNHTVNELWVGGTPATGGSLILSNTTIHVDGWLGLGRGNGTVNNTSTITMYNSTATFGAVSLGYDNGISGNKAQQFLTLNGASTFTDNGDMNLAESSGSTATVNINGTSVMTTPNRCYLGLNANTAGYMTIADSGQFTVGGWFSLANGDNSTGSLVVKGNASMTVSSDFNVTDTGNNTTASLTVQDNAVVSGNAVYFGKSANETVTATVSGGQLIARAGDFQMGASGTATLNQTGGSVIGTNWISIGRNSGGTAVYNISGGSLIKVFTGNGTRLNVAENGTGTLNVSGTGSVYLPICWLDICSGGGNGTINLNGGSITVQQVTHVGSGQATFNFNGGTLIAGVQGGPDLITTAVNTVNVLSGGANIDSGTNVVTIGNPLLGGANDGGLTKVGNGTLYLNGVNTYTNLTAVNVGTLGGSGTIAGRVTVASGATLAGPASGTIGALTINGNLTLAAGSSSSLKLAPVSSTNDSIVVGGNVTYAGTLVVSSTNGTVVSGGSFKLFNVTGSVNGNFSSVVVLPAGSGAGTFNPTTGVLTVAVVATPPTNNAPYMKGGSLILTGTGGLPNGSYMWLSTTNVANPMSTWITNTTGTFDATGAFSNAIPVDSSKPVQFFRLKE
jgi:autotransporter-associated beta strand protein